MCSGDSYIKFFVSFGKFAVQTLNALRLNGPTVFQHISDKVDTSFTEKIKFVSLYTHYKNDIFVRILSGYYYNNSSHVKSL